MGLEEGQRVEDALSELEVLGQAPRLVVLIARAQQHDDEEQGQEVKQVSAGHSIVFNAHKGTHYSPKEQVFNKNLKAHGPDNEKNQATPASFIMLF